MQTKKAITSASRLTSGLFMILALLWLTVSTPFVYAFEKQAHSALTQPGDIDDSEDSDPFSSTNEEKTENNSGALSEYLPNGLQIDHPFTMILGFCKCRPADLYFAFHPDLISPPPEA